MIGRGMTNENDAMGILLNKVDSKTLLIHPQELVQMEDWYNYVLTTRDMHLQSLTLAVALPLVVSMPNTKAVLFLLRIFP